MNIYEIPDNKEPVKELYVLLSVDENGNEGICAIKSPDGGAMPMIFGTLGILEIAIKSAKQMNADTGMKFRIVKFTQRETITEIK